MFKPALMGFVVKIYCSCSVNSVLKSLPRGRGTPCDGLYGEALLERAIFCRLQVYGKVCISLVELYKRVRKSVIWVCERAQKG